MNDFRNRNNRCANVWRELMPYLRAARFKLDASDAPLDPSGVAYVLKFDSCDVELGASSEIPRK
ncbi:MAG: hypothetical protein NVSMB56_20860 [Pyrinomonadaceae bacterium]